MKPATEKRSLTYHCATDDWDYAAELAIKDGFRMGSSTWMQRIRELLPFITEYVTPCEGETK